MNRPISCRGTTLIYITLILLLCSCTSMGHKQADDFACFGNSACSVVIENVITERIHGTLIRPTGEPVKDACCKLIDAEDREISFAISDASGKFSLPTVAEGEYRLNIRAYSGACNIFIKIQIKKGADHPLDIRIEECMEC